MMRWVGSLTWSNPAACGLGQPKDGNLPDIVAANLLSDARPPPASPLVSPDSATANACAVTIQVPWWRVCDEVGQDGMVECERWGLTGWDGGVCAMGLDRMGGGGVGGGEGRGEAAITSGVAEPIGTSSGEAVKAINPPGIDPDRIMELGMAEVLLPVHGCCM